MIRTLITFAMSVMSAFGFAACSENGFDMTNDYCYSRTSKITDVMSNPVFGDYGRLIFPVDDGYWSGKTLEDLRLIWYNYIVPNKTVEIVNYMHSYAAKGDTIFFNIYTDAEKAATIKFLSYRIFPFISAVLCFMKHVYYS